MYYDEQVGFLLGFDDLDIWLGDLMWGECVMLGKLLLDVQCELCICVLYVVVIENCDILVFDVFSFVVGYVWFYVCYLGMDSDWIFCRFCQELGFQFLYGMLMQVVGLKLQCCLFDFVEVLVNLYLIFLFKFESMWFLIELCVIGLVLVMVLLVCGFGYGGWFVL